MYDKTAADVAQYYGITPRVVTQWANNGYPLHRCGEITKVRLNGVHQIGAKSWRFNLNAVINHIENLSDEKWAYSNEVIKQKTGKSKSLKTGVANSTSTMSDSAKQCLALVKLQREKQKNYVRS